MVVDDVAGCFEEHGDALVRFAASQVGASHADDVVSAAVLDVLRHGTEGIHDLRAYLYRAVSNACIKHWRGLQRRQRRDLLLVPEPARPGDGTDEPADERVDVMLRTLAELSVQQRAVVHLVYWEDLSPSMAADRLGVSEGTVRRQLARARERLRKAFDGRS